MALDLSVIIRSEVLAQSPEFGLSVLASSRMTKEALETSEGGLFTGQFAELLGGNPAVNRDAPYLGLGEIVRAMPVEAHPALRDQAPNFWELNLTGPDTFCRNPAYEVSTLSSVTSFGSIRTSGVTARIAPELATRVWRAYLDMPRFETEKLFRLFSEIAALPGDSSSSLFAGDGGRYREFHRASVQ